MAIRFFLALILTGLTVNDFAHSQEIGEAGEFLVGWRNVAFQDSNYNRGRVEGRIYYPASTAGSNASADPSQGPFPLVGFLHGWIEPASDYDEICKHIASWGFVVMSNDTETGLFASMQAQAKDTRALMQWVEDESTKSGSWLHDMTNNEPWGAIGHSMGGGALSYLTRDESRVSSIVMFEPYKGSLLGNTASGFNSFNNYEGNVLVIAGNEDLTNNWRTVVRPWYERAESSKRRLWSLIEGGDHFGCTDPDIHLLWGFGSLSYASQHLAHRQLTTGFLLAELKGLENNYYEYLQTPYTEKEAASTKTPLWALTTNNNQLSLGSFTNTTNRLRIAGSFAMGNTNTIWGTCGLDLGSMQLAYNSTVDGNGIINLTFNTDASWQGLTLYFQALSNKGPIGSFSRTESISIP